MRNLESKRACLGSMPERVSTRFPRSRACRNSERRRRHSHLRRRSTLRIELTEPNHVRELVRFLRARGCIAYRIERSLAIEALRPLAPAGQERAELTELLAAWRAEHPTAALSETD